MTKPKLLKDLTLFSKYVSVKRATSALNLNATLLSEDMVDGGVYDELKVVNEDLVAVVEDLKDIQEAHKEIFLSSSPELVVKETQKPSDTFRDMYLSVIYLSGGDVTGCMAFLSDLIMVAYPTHTFSEQVSMSVDYTRELVKQRLIIPQVVILAEDGSELAREDLEDLEGSVEVTKIRLSISDEGMSLIEDVLEESYRRESRVSQLTEQLTEKLSLMNMSSPSKMLN